MKKLILFAAAATFALAANAKVWRVNYDENANADFRTITNACSSAKVANTDTLYCEAGYHSGSDDDNIISRQGMKVFGPGWGFEPNYGNTSTIADARFINEIQIAANDVLISGIVCNYQIRNSGKRKNITIDRCKVSYIYLCCTDTISGITIKNCYLGRIQFYSISKQLKNINIANNIIVSRNQYGFHQAIYMNSVNYNIVSNVNILRNTIVFDPYNDDDWLEAPVTVCNSLIQDNIIINPYLVSKIIDFGTDRGNIIRKNVLSMNDSEVGNESIIANFPDNYYVGATEAGTFTCANSTYRFEQYFQLKDGSPAKGKAYDGGDCGAFGGSTPYIICGRPQGMPYIYDVEVPAQPKDNKLHVTFKVANQNE